MSSWSASDDSGSSWPHCNGTWTTATRNTWPALWRTARHPSKSPWPRERLSSKSAFPIWTVPGASVRGGPPTSLPAHHRLSFAHAHVPPSCRESSSEEQQSSSQHEEQNQEQHPPEAQGADSQAAQHEQRSDDDNVLLSITESERTIQEPPPSLKGDSPTKEKGSARHLDAGDQGSVEQLDASSDAPSFGPCTRSQAKRSPAATLANFTTLKSLELIDDVARRDPSAWDPNNDQDEQIETCPKKDAPRTASSKRTAS